MFAPFSGGQTFGDSLPCAVVARAMIGGHTNLMQNHTNTMKVMLCPISVALKFMLHPVQLSAADNCEHDVHGDTNRDHRYRVNQTHDDEELGTQHRDQFRLTCSAFQEAATQDTDADRGTEGTQAHHQAAGNVEQSVFHVCLLNV